MALPSFLKRKDSPASPPASTDPLADDAAPVLQARTQARRRLIGAVVLLAIGVVVFPMLFETQPRPLPTDIPIELPRRDAPSPRPTPAPARHAAAVAEPVAEPAPAASAVATAQPSAPSEPPSAPASAAGDKPVAAQGPAHKPEKAASPAAAASDAKAGRFVVQVGAYTDAATLREVRAKVEKLGLKTYTQSIDTESGRRTRVRVGPFVTRAEAESASGKLKGAGLPGNILVL